MPWRSVSPRSSVRTEALSPIAAILYPLAPFAVFQVPLDGLADAGFEGFLRDPTQFAFDFAGINGVAKIVAGAILYVGDQVAVVADACGLFRHQLF